MATNNYFFSVARRKRPHDGKIQECFELYKGTQADRVKFYDPACFVDSVPVSASNSSLVLYDWFRQAGVFKMTAV